MRTLHASSYIYTHMYVCICTYEWNDDTNITYGAGGMAHQLRITLATLTDNPGSTFSTQKVLHII